jgi:hypothetical protein
MTGVVVGRHMRLMVCIADPLRTALAIVAPWRPTGQLITKAM